MGPPVPSPIDPALRWPRGEPGELAAFYGAFQLKADRFPTAGWEAAQLTTILSPYPMRASWDPKVPITRIRCHRLVAESLRRVLEGVLGLYRTPAGVRKAGMHRFGGCYSFRRVSGTERLSTHAWGARIDLDPARNPLGKAWGTSAGCCRWRCWRCSRGRGGSGEGGQVAEGLYALSGGGVRSGAPGTRRGVSKAILLQLNGS